MCVTNEILYVNTIELSFDHFYFILFFYTADQVKRHKKVFTKWINLQLAKVRTKADQHLFSTKSVYEKEALVVEFNDKQMLRLNGVKTCLQSIFKIMKKGAITSTASKDPKL